MNRIKQRLLFSIVVAVGAVLVNWLILWSSSPLHVYLLRHGSGIEDLWLALNVIPIVVAALASHNHGGGDELVYVLLLFVQWFTIAFLVSSFVFRLFARRVFTSR